MKKIENIDLKKCFQEAEQQVQAELEAQVTKKIKEQLMAVAQLKIKANNSITEAEKIKKQLESKEAQLSRMQSGEWDAVPDSAKERDEAAQTATKEV